jgi:sensor histidine kinase YesM
MNWYLQVLYNLCYLGFIAYYLNLKVNDLKLNRFILNSSNFLLIGFSIFFIFCLLIQNQTLFINSFLYVFIPTFLIVLFYSFYRISLLKGKLKYFIYAGSISYSILASYTFYLSFYSDSILFFKNSTDPLTLGLFLEVLIFSYGLAYKIKMINDQKMIAQKKIILFQNNEKLIKEEHQRHLEKQLQVRETELLEISRKTEKEKLDTITANYEGRLALLQLKTLSNQMNPHFIFNALNSIKAYLIVNDQKNAIFYLNQFAKLVRHILESLREDYITLKEELDIIKIYMNLENMRFGYSIDFQLSISPDINAEEIRIPTLILQPFIENALVHGLLPKSGERTLIVDVYKKNEDVIINIVDNGIGREASNRSKNDKVIVKKSIGLRIINERLNLYNKKHDYLMKYDIEDLKREEVASGTKVCLTISEREN